MNEFWGYAHADTLAVVIIAGLSLLSLICALRFVKHY